MMILQAYLLGVNCATFAFYGYDKAMARAGKRRIRESTLHLLAAAGGTPGAIVAQRVFRHKTCDRSFRRVFWTIAVIQTAVVIWLLWTRRF